LSHESDQRIELELRGVSYTLGVGRIGPDRHRVTVVNGTETHSVVAHLDRIDEVHSRLRIGDQRYRLVTAGHGPTRLVEVYGVAHRITRDEGGVLRAPSPALVVATPVAVGDEVEAGARVVVLESMKMETAITAPTAGRLKELLVRTGTQVEAGEALARLEPTGDEPVAEQAAGGVVDLPADPTRQLDLAGRASLVLSVLRDLVLGYDVRPERTSRLLEVYLEGRDALAKTGVDVLAEEMALVELFTDIAELTRNRPGDEELRTELRVHSSREHFHTYLRTLDLERGGLPDHFRDKLARVLAHYGVTELEERTPELEAALFRIFLAQQSSSDVDVIVGILQRWHTLPAPAEAVAWEARALLERMVRATQRRVPAIGDLARSIRFGWFDQPQVDGQRRLVLSQVAGEVAALSDPNATDRAARIDALTEIPEQLVGFLRDRLLAAGGPDQTGGVPEHEPLLEVLLRRHYLEYDLHDLAVIDRREPASTGSRPVVRAEYLSQEHGPTRVVSTIGSYHELAPGGPIGTAIAAEQPSDHATVSELYLRWAEPPRDRDAVSAELNRVLSGQPFVTASARVTIAVCADDAEPVGYYTFRPDDSDPDRTGGLVEDVLLRDMHPMVWRRLNLWRLRDFEVTRLDAPSDVLLYECVAHSNPDDRRLVAAAQVRQLAAVRSEDGRLLDLPHAERAVENCLEAIRRVRTARGKAGSKLEMNHVWITVWPPIRAELEQLAALQDKITPLSDGTGIEEVLAQGRVIDDNDQIHQIAIRFRARPDGGTAADVIAPPTKPLRPLDDYQTKVRRSRRRGMVYPYELAASLTRGGSVVEYDLDETGVLVPVDRPRGRNSAGMIVAAVTTPTSLYPQGITRVVLCGDPTKSLGALSEAECSRVIAALDLAEQMAVPVEWYAISSGARVSMTSGTENMDWVAAALKRIVEFTQDGGEINVVVAGINVGAQPYWNAEATMLMHTKGILVMTPDSAMVLTGKQTLDFAGSVSAEDNFGIGGYDRIMGPNGQAQYWAADLAGALDIVLAHYEHSYIVPGERAPRRASTEDPVDRDISSYPHPGGDFATVGEVFSAEHNPDRKRPFDIRTVMRAVADADHQLLERWAGMADAETAVVVDTRLGGNAVCLIGIESKPVPRAGFPPSDGPDTYTAGTLFPQSSKKVARAINAASGNRPVVILANLSGFDGSPESMRNLQLEYGAEIGRAMVNFDGPIVFCVISRYHGGAFVVFSKRLNPRLTVLAVEGSYASVLGGAPAAAVVFASEVAKRAAADPRIAELEQRIAGGPRDQRGALAIELADLRAAARAEKISELAAEFDGVHNIQRAVEVGSVDEVIAAAEIRPKIISAIERGLADPSS
ncbi:MAG TPA: carboxyl transferase domain-containing protein, partial [Microlunatus sp.]